MSLFTSFGTRLLTLPKTYSVNQCVRLFSVSLTSTSSCWHASSYFLQSRSLSKKSLPAIQQQISSLQIKKRPVRKKKIIEDDVNMPGTFDVAAFATAEEYDLESLMKGLQKQDLYEANIMDQEKNVVYAVAKYQVVKEPREIFFFREGSVVMWNINELESSNLLAFLKQYEQDSYSEETTLSENEIMKFKFQDEGKSGLGKNDEFILSTASENIILDKYTISNVMTLSVKLGVWESLLEKYIDSIEAATDDLKAGKITMTRGEVLRKHGELFALRHLINLSSDLLDTPDFYWDHERLESLYSRVCAYFCIAKRTKVMNEKLNHCVELIELLSTHLNDKHHTRLEWMIIILIMVEVCFETVHYVERWMN